jgi:hypothetical protein
MRPLSETTFGRRVFNLAPRSAPKAVSPSRRSPPARAPTVDRQRNGGLVAPNQQRSYAAAAASNPRPSPPIAPPPSISPDVIAFMEATQRQIAELKLAIQQQALLIQKVLLHRQKSAINNDERDDSMDDNKDGDIDAMNEETKEFLDDAAPSLLERKLAAAINPSLRPSDAYIDALIAANYFADESTDPYHDDGGEIDYGDD